MAFIDKLDINSGLTNWLQNSTILHVDGVSKVGSSNSSGYPDSYYKQGESGIPMMYIYLAISGILIYFLVKRYGK